MDFFLTNLSAFRCKCEVIIVLSFAYAVSIVRNREEKKGKRNSNNKTVDQDMPYQFIRRVHLTLSDYLFVKKYGQESKQYPSYHPNVPCRIFKSVRFKFLS